MPKGKPTFRIEYGELAAEYASDLARELKKAGLRVVLGTKPFEPARLFGGAGVAGSNVVEIHQAISDAWPYIAPFIPIIYEAIKGLVRKKRRKGDTSRTRVKLRAAKDEIVVDFNDKQIEEREHKPEGPPMIVPDVSKVMPVPEDPERKVASRKTAKMVPKKPAKKAKPPRKK